MDYSEVGPSATWARSSVEPGGVDELWVEVGARHGWCQARWLDRNLGHQGDEGPAHGRLDDGHSILLALKACRRATVLRSVSS
jgi:hypothetical protein